MAHLTLQRHLGLACRNHLLYHFHMAVDNLTKLILVRRQAGVLKRAERLSVPSLILTAQDFADGKALEDVYKRQARYILTFLDTENTL